MTRLAWVLNLDAEEELRAPGAYRRSLRMEARLRELAGGLGGLIAAGDVVVFPSSPGAARAARGLPGRSWCPTPEALARLREAGAAAPPGPSAAVLRAVNARRFAARLGAVLPGARTLEAGDSLPELLEGPWIAKSGLGFAGRGARRLHGVPTREDRAWLAARLAEGHGVLLEPWVDRLLDVAQHGWVDGRGEVRLGEPTVQTCDARGHWCGSRRAAAGDLQPGEREALAAAAARAGSALFEAGYFGPFGVDGFRWQAPGGASRFRPLGELNARFTMGWAVGTGAAGREWVEAGG